MSAGRDSLLELVGLVYEAALEPALWRQAAAGATTTFDATHVRIGVIDRRGRLVIDAPSHDLNQLAYNLPAYLLPETNPGVAFSASTPPMTVAGRDQLMSDRDMERLEFYDELMRPHGFWHAAVVNVHRDEALLAPMGVMRARSQRPFDESELRALRALAPHLNRALRVTLQLREMEARAGALAETGDRALTAIVLTDAFGRVAEANGLARVILAEGDGLLIRDGILRAGRGCDSAKLARLIHEAAGARVLPMSGVMQVERPSGRRAIALVVSPTRAAAAPFGRSHAVCVSFADPERAAEADADLLARLYGFTAREAAVAVLLLRGRSPREAADELATNENTVRTHIRHLFDKTGVERLADLVRLLMQGPGVRGG
jgi:DNA-binding CsgD family transcriptional regulator